MNDKPATLVSCFAVLTLAACADTPNPNRLAMERVTHGDTTVVRITGGSVWDSAALVEELRIGKLDGAEEEMFGFVSEVEPDGQGGVYVFDGRVPALRHFDRNGTYKRTLGAAGSGPGEYRDAALGLHRRSDGRLLMRDPRNARINVYDSTGTPVAHWPVASGLFTSNSMVVDTAHHLYLKILLGQPEPNKPWPIGLLHLDPEGQLIDTIPPPTVLGDPESPGGYFAVGKVWELSPLGPMIVGLNSAYTFEIRSKDGTVIRVEKQHTPIPVNPEEHAELEAMNEWMRRARAQFLTADIPPLPDTKPAYRNFAIGHDGRIWVRLYTAASKVDPIDGPAPQEGMPPPPAITWREDVIYDVFDPDGTYLGQVRMPDRTSLAAQHGDEIWALQRGELDEPYVVRYRLVTSHAQ